MHIDITLRMATRHLELAGVTPADQAIQHLGMAASLLQGLTDTLSQQGEDDCISIESRVLGRLVGQLAQSAQDDATRMKEIQELPHDDQ